MILSYRYIWTIFFIIATANAIFSKSSLVATVTSQSHHHRVGIPQLHDSLSDHHDKKMRSKITKRNYIEDSLQDELSIVADHSQTNSKNTLSLWELCVCGAFASAFADFVMHPIDTIKVFQQTSKVATTILSATSQIWKSGGIIGFYPGVLPYVFADSISGSIKFAVFEFAKTFSEYRLNPKYYPISRFVCAAIAMLACSIALVPGEVIKTRLQSGAYGSFSQMLTTTLSEGGISGLFTGYAATMIRDIPYTMLELGLYENIKSFIRSTKNKQDLDSNEELLAAAITGGITAFVTTPLDLVKTRLMVQSTGSVVYGGVLDALHSIYSQGGISALFVGSSARIAWLLPFTTLYLGMYEYSKRKIIEIRKKD